MIDEDIFESWPPRVRLYRPTPGSLLFEIADEPIQFKHRRFLNNY